MLAMDVNDDAGSQDERGVWTFFASRARSYRVAFALPLILILIHPPLRKAEWRRSSGDWRAAPFDAVELIACRCQRSQPEGDAPG